MSFLLSLCLLLMAPQSAEVEATGPVAETPAPARQISTIHLDVRGLDPDVLSDSLAVRIGDVSVQPRSEDALAPDAVYVGVRQSQWDAHVFELSLITADGRAYDRRVDVQRVDPARTLALTIVGLLGAIEDDAIKPDRQDATLPDDPPADPSPPAYVFVDARPAPNPPAPPPIEVGVRGAGLVGVSLGAAGAPVTAGGQLSTELRLPRGATVGFDVRGLGWRNVGYALQRLRVGAGAGYTWRGDAFELGAMGLLTVEPWRVTPLDGSEPLLRADGSRARTTPLLGAAIRIAPGFRWSDEHVALRVGPTLELTGSASYDGQWGIPSIARRDPNEVLFQPGGAEIFGGLDLTVWIPVSNR